MTTLILNNQFKQFDANGVPLAAGKIYTYVVGTTTNKLTYQDEAKVAEHENPIILDAWGESTIWIDGDTKFVVTDSDDVTIRTYDSFSDTQTTGEFPVVSSPLGGVYRSEATDIGYIKIQLPMGEWPNTKMMFDVMIYTDDADEAFTLTLGGYADSNTSAWLTTTAITNGIADYTVQFGNDGTYPAIYIGAVGTNWVKPQVAVTNFLAGQFSYDWATWDNGWNISVTTSLGTITSTDTATSINTRLDNMIESGTKMVFYQDVAPTGWTLDGSVTDKVIAVKGGSSTYNAAGGTTAGSFTVPFVSHDHVVTGDGGFSDVVNVATGSSGQWATTQTTQKLLGSDLGSEDTPQTYRPQAAICIICTKD